MIRLSFGKLIAEAKRKSDEEFQQIAQFYGVRLSIHEIQQLRPMLDDISIQWYFTGIPQSFIQRMERTVGKEKTKQLLLLYQSFVN